jgi:flavin reductase (DIM6/NTAB) family NADH-FMN oxidoreductase RutF
MRKNFGPKSWLYPMPVLIIGTYDESGAANAMNAAWGMISDTDKVTICLDKKHKTVKNIMKKKEFTVSMADAKNVVAADYIGIISGNDVADKVAKTGWMPFWWGNKFNKRLASKRARQAEKKKGGAE